MSTTNLQVPVSKSLKTSALAAAKEYGFSSLQEFVRVVLTKLAKREIGVNITEQFPPVQLSKKTAERYDKMAEEIESGKVKTKIFTNVEELMEDLTK